MKVTYLDHMGTDLSVVNAARVSFSKESKGYQCVDHDVGIYELPEADKRLIQFLARGCTSGDWEQLLCDMGGAAAEEFEAYATELRRMPSHWTPFAHTSIQLHIKAPIFVARQLGKHQTGFVWNEVSRRYVDEDPEFYFPKYFRARAERIKQGSDSGEVGLLCCDEQGRQLRGLPTLAHSSGRVTQSVGVAYTKLLELYREMLMSGVCPEQARMVLPQSMYTEWWMTGNLYAWANLFIQRTDSHAQRETQEVAHQIGRIIEPLFPVSWKALTQ